MECIKNNSFVRNIIKGRWGYFFLLPGLILFFVFSFIPILSTIRLSFYKAGITEEVWYGFKNYSYIFKDSTFLKAFRNTFHYILIIVPLNVTISLFIASVISNTKNWVQSLFRGTFYLPTVVGGVIVSAVWLWIYHPVYGLFNYVINLFGAKPIYWLADTRTALPALCLVVLTWTVGTSVIVYLAGISNISVEVYEAAKIDGAGRLKCFLSITLPLLKPVTVFIVTTQLINVFQIWEVIYMLTGGGPNYNTISVVYYLYETAFVAGKFGVASAQGVVLTIVILIFSTISLKVSKEF